MGLDDTTGLLSLAFDGGDRQVGDLLERIRPRLVMWAAASGRRSLTVTVGLVLPAVMIVDSCEVCPEESMTFRMAV